MEILTACAYQIRLPKNDIMYLVIQADHSVVAHMNGKLAIPSTIELSQRTRRPCRNAWKPKAPSEDHRRFVLVPRRKYRLTYDGAVLAHIEPFGKAGWCVARTGLGHKQPE